MRNVTISRRELRIAYDIDKKPLQSLANEYGVTIKEMKNVIRQCGMTVRKNEEIEEITTKNNIIITE